MLTYDLEQATGPLYQYIYQCLKDDIMTGGLQAVTNFPPRELLPGIMVLVPLRFRMHMTS